MFELTRREQLALVGFLCIFVLGLGVMHWRGTIHPTTHSTTHSTTQPLPSHTPVVP